MRGQETYEEHSFALIESMSIKTKVEKSYIAPTKTRPRAREKKREHKMPQCLCAQNTADCVERDGTRATLNQM